ncbi:MAG: Rieske (2Fe-2S) protein [Dehalococcoidia bacterium]
MAEYVKAAQLKDVPPGSMHVVQVDGEQVVLANVDGQLFAFGGVCTHRGGPLAEGDLLGTVVTCPWHAGQFDVRTGEVVSRPPAEPVATYQVQVEGDDIKVARV